MIECLKEVNERFLFRDGLQNSVIDFGATGGFRARLAAVPFLLCFGGLLRDSRELSETPACDFSRVEELATTDIVLTGLLADDGGCT